MKPGVIGLVLIFVGSVLLVVFSPLYSPDLALVPPGPVNSHRFALLYYVPRIVLSSILCGISVLVIFTDSIAKVDKYLAYAMIVAVIGSWRFWLAG